MEGTLAIDSTAGVLAAARAEREASLQAEGNLLQYAAQWAAMHPAESMFDAACLPSIPGSEEDIAIAGEGAPLVAEFCVPEFAAAVGMTPDAGRRLLGAAVELRYRLRRCWGRVVAGDLPAWRARSIAERTMGLSEDAARFVDRQVAFVAHKIGPIQLDRLIGEALVRFQPEVVEERRQSAAEDRQFRIWLQDAGTTGTVNVDGVLDVADALDLEAAVAAKARQLAALGLDESLDVRRSMALGEIARRDLTLDLGGGGFEAGARAPSSTTEGCGGGFETAASAASSTTDRSTDCSVVEEVAQQPSRNHPTVTRHVVLHVHLTDRALAGTDPVGRCEETGAPVLVSQIRDWCQSAGKITVRPVLDLADHTPVDSYELPDRLRRQIRLRDHHCVFPWCTRPAKRCDLDHRQPYDRGGPTAADNLAPLCRRHHRLKTHGGWTYTMLEPGTYLWRSPHGYTYYVDHTGTEPADPPAHSPGEP